MDLATTTEKVQYLAGKADEPIGSSVKFDLGEAVVFLDGTGASNTVHNKDEEADCTVRMSHEDFDQMLAGKLSPTMAMMTGKLGISGDISVAMKLAGLFS